MCVTIACRPAVDENRVDEIDIARVIGQAAWARLHPSIRRRFAAAHLTSTTSYEGHMHLRRSLAGLLISLLAWPLGRPLPTAQGDNYPTRVEVRPDGRGGILWIRGIRLPGGVQRVVSTKRPGHGRHAGRLLECVRGGLGMVLDLSERDGALVFESRHYFLAVGPLVLPLPHLLSPGRCTVSHADAGDGRFRFTLSMRHPLFGETFHQSGLFSDPPA